jgi:hypothetical protein
MCKPWDGGPDQPPLEGGAGDSSLIDTGLDPIPALPMDISMDLSRPLGLACLPSLEELAPTLVYAASALASALALGLPSPSSPPPLHGPSLELDSSTLDQVVAWASASRLFQSPFLVVGKCSWASSLPSPSLPASIVYILTLPPPAVGMQSSQIAPDWQD